MQSAEVEASGVLFTIPADLVPYFTTIHDRATDPFTTLGATQCGTNVSPTAMRFMVEFATYCSENVELFSQRAEDIQKQIDASKVVDFRLSDGEKVLYADCIIRYSDDSLKMYTEVLNAADYLQFNYLVHSCAMSFLLWGIKNKTPSEVRENLNF